MASPLLTYSTARLTFRRPVGLTADALGNFVPKTEALEVLAFLKVNANETRKRGEGIDPLAVYLQGYATDPANLSSYELPSIADCNMGGIAGVLELDIFQNPPFGRATFGAGTNIGKIVEEALGTKLQGWFIPNKS